MSDDAALTLREARARYFRENGFGEDGGIDDFCRMLAAGIDVVTTSVPGLVHPAAFDPKRVARLEEACRKGGATLYASGIEPGFAGDQLVLTLATLTHKIRSVRTQEIFSYADYPPVVCDAAPGVVSILDLPLFTARVPKR